MQYSCHEDSQVRDQSEQRHYWLICQGPELGKQFLWANIEIRKAQRGVKNAKHELRTFSIGMLLRCDRKKNRDKEVGIFQLFILKGILITR